MPTTAPSTFAPASRPQPQSGGSYGSAIPIRSVSALEARLHDDIDLRIAEAVLLVPGQTQAEIALRLGFSCTLVHRRVAGLARVGGILRTQCGLRVRSYPSDCLASCVARQKEAPAPGGALRAVQVFQEMVCA